MRTNTLFAFACKHGTNFDAFDARFFDSLGFDFVNLFVGADQFIFRIRRIHDVIASVAAHEAFTELDDFVFTLVNRLAPHSVKGAAIDFPNDHVLRHVDQLAGHVTRVSGLERGIRQTFAGAVSRDEILEHGQTFAEV